MTDTLLLTPAVQKIADFTINVKYLRPGSVVAYLPVQFEVFNGGEEYRAVPILSLQKSILTNLPKELVFKIKGGKPSKYKQRHKEVIEDIVSTLDKLALIEKDEARLQRKSDTTSCCLGCGSKVCSKNFAVM